MGLDIDVGVLSSYAAEDPEIISAILRDIDRINSQLEPAGFKPHREPRRFESEYLSWQMWGYAGLHYLRRIALHYDKTRTLVPPGPARSDDLFTNEYKALSNQFNDRCLVAMDMAGRPYVPFSHLIFHGDADGTYLPIEFAGIVILEPGAEVLGTHIGSSYALLNECKKLAQLLEVPDDLDPEDKRLWDATDSQGVGDSVWQQYAIETFTCIRLIRACEASINTGGLLLYC